MKTYKIIEEADKKYILAVQVPEYAEEVLKTSFNIPSARSLRLYMQEGVIERPLKRGKEAYLELKYAIGVISLLRELRKWGLTLNTIKRIVLNVRKHNKFEEAVALLEVAGDSYVVKEYPRYFFKQLATENPASIKISRIEEDTMKLVKKESAEQLKKIEW